MNDSGKIVVTDMCNDRVQVLTEDGEHLLTFGENGELDRPVKCIYWGMLIFRVRTLFCEQNSRLFPDFFQTIFFIFQTQDNSEILHSPRRNNCLNYENNE